MGAFLKELRSDVRSPVPWVLWLTLALVVSVAGPFGSYGALDIPQRVLFWTPIIFVAVAVGTLLRAFVYAGLGLRGRLSGALLISGLNSLLLCPFSYLLMNSVFPQVFSAASTLSELVLLVVSLSLGVCALRVSVEPELEAGAASAPQDMAADLPEPRLARRLDAGKRGEIWALSVRDHYVDVHTSQGKSSLLMRFSDAMDEVSDVPGAQVHRSHWVAWAGVGSVCREGGKMNLHLKNGHQVPVSRNNRGKVDARFPLIEPGAMSQAKGAA